MASRACPHCGARHALNDEFCKACGTRLGLADRQSLVRRVLQAVVDVAPGLASLRVVVGSAVLLVLAVGLPVATGRCLSHWDYGWLIGLPLIGITLGVGFLCYWAVLCWLLTGFLSNPLDLLSEMRSVRRGWLFVAAILPPLAIVALTLMPW
jgi:hypothetical protein